MAKKNKVKNGRAKSRPLVVVFSGTRSLQNAQFPYIDEVLDALKAKVFISGGAYGVDTYCSTEAIRRFPKAQHYIVVPYGYRQNDVHLAWCMQQAAKGRFVDLLDMPAPARGERQHPNILRNEYMIKLAQRTAAGLKTEARLVAFPGGPNEVIRSGTWTTIRRARAAGIPVDIYPLSEANGTVIAGQIES